MAYDVKKRVLAGHFKDFAERIKRECATKASVTNLENRMNEIVAGGGEPNAINKIKVNGTELTIAADKSVDVSVPTKTSDLNNDSGFQTQSQVQDAIDDGMASVDTLIGTDTGKTVRQIANEELAKQLIPENAAESLDSLEELAAWIQTHPEDAAAMNKAINDLKALVGTLPEGATSTDIVSYIAEVLSNYYTKPEIDGMDATDAEIEEMLDEIFATT